MKSFVEGSAQNILDLLSQALDLAEATTGRKTQHENFCTLHDLLSKSNNIKIAKDLKQDTIEKSIYHKASKACKEKRESEGLRFWSIYLNSISQLVHSKDFEEVYGCYRDEQPILKDIEKRPDQGLNDIDSSFFESLSDLGITGTTSKLTNSQFEPAQSMKAASQTLFFMGILGSKWVEDLEKFEEFLGLIQSKNCKVRFLMINPNGQSFQRLKTMRGGNLNDKSSVKFKKFVMDYPCLEVKFYDFIPSFRLIFIDGKILAVSRYKLDKKGYFQSKQGWDAPHLVIEENAIWSLYEPFLSYYNFIWDTIAKDINKVIK